MSEHAAITPLKNVIVKHTQKEGLTYYFNPPKDIRGMDILHHQVIGYNFVQAAQEAKRLNNVVDEIRRGNYDQQYKNQTVRTLAHLFFESTKFTEKSSNTKRAYKTGFKNAAAMHLSARRYITKDKPITFHNLKFETMALDLVSPFVADVLYKELIRHHDVSSANASIRVLRRIWACGIRWEMVEKNPFVKMEMKQEKPREVIWSAQDAARFVQNAERLGYAGMALAVRLSFWLGIRPGDLIRLRGKDVTTSTVANSDGSRRVVGVLAFYQKKTGHKITMPLPQGLTVFINRSLNGVSVSSYQARENAYIVRPPNKGVVATCYTYDQFHADFEKIKKETSIPDNLTFRDLRRTAITGLNGTDDEKKLLSGHKSRVMLDTYSVPEYNLLTRALEERAKAVKESDPGSSVSLL